MRNYREREQQVKRGGGGRVKRKNELVPREAKKCKGQRKEANSRKEPSRKDEISVDGKNRNLRQQKRKWNKGKGRE